MRKLDKRTIEERDSIAEEEEQGEVNRVWSENWICMKMRYFATAARRSR